MASARPLVQLALALGVVSATGLPAQRGDQKGEQQSDNVLSGVDVPPAPVLSPDQALVSFRLPPGFRVELVASEPLIHDPVCLAFDGEGKIWVVEMRGFMPNVDGEGELEPNGRVVVLEDADGDGRMDKSTVFLDGLVLPRAIGLWGGGALIIEPPHLWYCRDTDDDGRADEKTLVADGFDDGLRNPEHSGNGLIWGLDNWFRMARDNRRLRWENGGWRIEKTFSGGQWGVCQDDWGRLYYNYNSDQLRADLYPGHYAVRNPNLGVAKSANHRVAKDQSVWPIRVTPGVNRGYRNGLLKEGVLTRFTAVCGPAVYRGELCAPEWSGDAFVCEPSGNLVRRNRVLEQDGVLTARNAYEQSEFMASTDERFRPVNVYSGPDGALYVVDMYRGIIQHRNFVTSFLRKQILDRGLDKPLGLGRIYRVVPEGRELEKPPDLWGMPPLELVACLEHGNGWVRDTAQQILVWWAQQSREGPWGGKGVIPDALRALARTAVDPRARIHALWTLQGTRGLDRTAVVRALFDDDPRVRVQGVRLAEFIIADAGDELLELRLRELARDPDARVRGQLVLTLGELSTTRSADLLVEIMRDGCADALLRTMAASSLHGRELEHLDQLLAGPGFDDGDRGRAAYAKLLARCIAKERDPARMLRLLDIAGARPVPWQQRAVLEGILQSLPKGSARRGALELAGEPRAWPALEGSADAVVRERAAELGPALRWPGSAVTAAVVEPLSTPQQQRYERGAAMFAAVCAACHQPTGAGRAGLAPPLVNTEWTLGSEQRLVRIVLQGVAGKIEVRGQRYDLLMPGHPHLNDDQIAGVLTYIRRAWGHQAAPIDPATVRAVRAVTAGRVQPWTAEELKKIN